MDSAAQSPMLSRAAWVRVLPFLIYLGFIVVVDLLGRAGVPAESLRWLYPLKIAVVGASLLLLWRQYTELHRWNVSPLWTALALAIGAAVFVLWVSLNAGWMIVGTPGGFDPRNGAQIDWLLVVLRIAGAALVVPVMEELFWRSFLMRWLDTPDFLAADPGKVSLKSVAIAALLFGFEHNQWLAGIVAGVAYSLLYRYQKSLWSAILAHALTNGVLGVWIVHTGRWTYW